MSAEIVFRDVVFHRWGRRIRGGYYWTTQDGKLVGPYVSPQAATAAAQVLGVFSGQ